MATYDVDGAREMLNEMVTRSLMGEKITISTGCGNVVMVCEEDWDSLVELVSAMLLPGLRERLTVDGIPVPDEA